MDGLPTVRSLSSAPVTLAVHQLLKENHIHFRH